MEVLDCTDFDVELKALLDALLKDVCVLAARWRTTLHREISASKTENQELRRRLHILEQKLSSSFQVDSVRHPDTRAKTSESDFNDDQRKTHEYEKRTVNTDTERVASKEDPWQWIPALAGIKEEQIEISVTGRAEHNPDAASGDVLHTTHYTDNDENLQSSELKTECKNNTEPEIQTTGAEHSGDDSIVCEEDTEAFSTVDEVFESKDQGTQHGHLSPHKIEEEDDGEKDEEQEQFDTSLLLTHDVHLNHASYVNNSESTSSDSNAFVILEGNTDASTASASDVASGPSKSKNQKGPRYICNICGKSLSSKYSLTVHFTMHTGDRPYACTQCGKRFVNRTNLQIHQNIHTGAKPYVCALCPKSFADPSPFGRHKKMHSRELQQSNHTPKCEFICNICGKSLSTKQGLSYHITMHTGERPYMCTWCGKSFVQKHNLKIHQNIHTGAKPYTCTLCSKSFADPSSLKKHKRMHM